MTTALELVTAAFRKIGVSATDETLTADEVAEGISALNMMLHGWKLRGVDLVHANLAPADTFALAAAYDEGTVYMLASRLNPNYMIPPSFDADDWFRGIQAAYMIIDDVAMPAELLRLPSQTTRRTGY